MSGQQLSARYTLRERLSTGAPGETWRAHDAARDRDVVVKFLPHAIASEAAVMHSLRVELEAARSLDPRMIAAAEALERDAGQHYLLREYVPGRDLSTLRGESWRRIVPAAAQLAEALAALHGRGIVHRDVKSSNVVLRPDGTATLIDLGAAAFSGSAADNAALSPYGASPQQLAGDPPAPADDVYGFGALLYELLSGYPPFYPNFSRHRVLHEPVAVLKPARAAPAELIDLVMQLLAKSPADRPTDIAEVGRRLRELERAPDEAAPTPAVAAEAAPVPTIVRPILRSPVETARERGRSGTDARRRWVIGAAFALLALLAASVSVFLPEFARRSAPVVANVGPATTPAARAEPGTAASEPEVDLRALAEQMQEAERMRDAYDALYPSLEKRAAAEWAAQPFAAAREHADEARRQFEARKFLNARAAFAAGLGELRKVSDRARPVLAEQLDKGKAALDTGQSSAAEAAFALALRIDSGNQTAAKGLKRAQTLDQVLALMAAGGSDERAGQLQSAAQRYEQALKLDPDAQSARDGLTRVRARIANDEFALAMSLGLKQLDSGNLQDARASFERAGRLRPGALEVNEALARVAELGEQRAIAAHRARAVQLEREERWREALSEYEAALKLDPSLEFALSGRARVAPRVELAQQMDTLIADPRRLLAAAVRDQARALLTEAQKIPAPGPVLRRQLQSLNTSLAQYETPVRVALLSDNQTEVVIYRVGPMGAFERREIELLPGTYTVMGTRVGFRDVRRELTVLPGETPSTLAIRCEDPI